MQSLADKFISNSADWNNFFAAACRLDASTQTNKPSKGKVFERLTQLYLQTHPEYQTKLKNVWLAPDLPRAVRKQLALPPKDEGIDLVGETYEGEYWAIQCKFRSDTSKALTVTELSTFTNLSFNVCKNFTLALVVHTCAKPVKKRELLGNTAEVGLDRWLQISDEDWQRIRLATKGKSKPPVKRKPRNHQKQAIAAAQKHFITGKASRGRLIMPCGTGKSLTAFWIAEELEAKTILVAVPSLYLIKAGIEDWTRESVAKGERPEWLVVCSDESTGKVEQDEFVGQVYDLGIDATTDSVRIQSFLKRRTQGRKIVFCTYQSGKVLAEAVQSAKARFDLGIFDEAHRTVGNPDKVFSHLVSDRNIKIKRRLFMTATERVARGDRDDVLSMDDTETYGDRFYQLTFKQAIHSDPPIICDYKIITIAVSDLEVRELIEQNRYLKTDDKTSEREAITLAAGIALQRMFDEKKVTHAITFHRSIRAAEGFKEQHEKLITAKRRKNKPACFHVSSKKTTGERAELIQDYRSEAKAIMTNARCLQEGVDIPAVDCVMFADPKQSVVDIVQAAGRAMRPAQGKTFGYVALPIVVPMGMDFAHFAETTEFRQVARVVTALSTQDERIVEEFRTVESRPRGTGRIVEITGAVPAGTKIDFSAFSESIRLKLWESVGRANFLDFEAARDKARTLPAKSVAEWQSLKVNRLIPPDIPWAPDQYYKGKGWIGWGDWFGTGRVATFNRTYRLFEEAREYARALNLGTRAQWIQHVHSGNLPEDIPAKPERTYKESGWVCIGDWLGTGRISNQQKSQTGFYRPFEDARAFVRTLGLNTRNQWNRYCKSKDKPYDIPSTPERVYAEHGWAGVGDWLGTGVIASFNREYLPFEEARTFARRLNLQSIYEWRNCCQLGMVPQNIPFSPDHKYKKVGWISWGDWLGTGRIAKPDQYRSFIEAREFSRNLRLISSTAWREFCSSGKRPKDIPSRPQQAYKDKGWAGWKDWLATGTEIKRQGPYLPFDQARAFARSLKLKSVSTWSSFARSQEYPNNIPLNPDRFYRNKGWAGYSDWLGTPVIATHLRQYRQFEKARDFVRSLRLRTGKDWKKYCISGRLPADIPKTPSQVYANDGWVGIGDWIGSTFVPLTQRKYLSFKGARAYARDLGLKTSMEWDQYVRSGKLTPEVPSRPSHVYRDSGWIDWGDWLGTGSKNPTKIKWLSFEEARAWVRKQCLKSVKAWLQFVKEKKLRPDVPTNPQKKYADTGWAGWKDWLGCE